MNEPIIKLAPGEAAIKRMVDALIVPEMAEEQVKALFGIVSLTADTEDNYKSDTTAMILRHAFTKTESFERAFRQFQGFPLDEQPPPDTRRGVNETQDHVM